jgi:outer membrane autotransporter protein
LASGRLSGTRSVSSGSETLGNRAWVQGFGTIGKGDAHDGADSYDANTYGAAAGVDGKVLDGNTTLGAAISYGLTNIESDNANKTETDIDSYQLTLVEGVVAYAWNTVESTRKNVGGVAGLTAKGDYDAQTYAARAAVGHDFGIQDGITITPKAFVEYVSFNADKYTETGAGGANLTVDTDTADQLNVGTSVEIANSYVNGDGSLLKPSVNVGYKYDTINDNVNSTSTFAVGGASFVTKGADQEAGTITAGLGVDYYSTSNYQLTLDYGYENKDSYEGHSGVARASYRF